MMPSTITASFADRRSVELAVEHLVQEYGLARTDIFIEPVGDANSAGVESSGADVESGHPGVSKDGEPALGGALRVSVDMNEDEVDAVMKAFRDAGATDIVDR